MKKIVVLGAGVSGLTTSLVLARQGHSVRILAKDMPEHTTSSVAGAFWAPFLAEPRDKVHAWSKYTLEYLQKELVSVPESGVSIIMMREYFDKPTADPWWSDTVDKFGRIPESELLQGYTDGYYAQLALMDTSVYLPWLAAELTKLGVSIEQGVVNSFDELPDTQEIIVNCTGLGSRELCNDTRIYPIRGQVVRVKPTGMDIVVADDDAHNSLAYIIPRTNDVILGGTAQENDWNLEVVPEDTAAILRKARLLSPQFETPEILDVKVGLRPFRDEVRLEVEQYGDRTIIHNYGHGGSGYTLSWGCAQEVAELAQGFIK